MMMGRETNLKEQLELYQSQVNEMESNLGGTTTTFNSFRKEMDRLTKQLKKVERDTDEWKNKFQESQVIDPLKKKRNVILDLQLIERLNRLVLVLTLEDSSVLKTFTCRLLKKMIQTLKLGQSDFQLHRLLYIFNNMIICILNSEYSGRLFVVEPDSIHNSQAWIAQVDFDCKCKVYHSKST